MFDEADCGRKNSCDDDACQDERVAGKSSVGCGQPEDTVQGGKTTDKCSCREQPDNTLRKAENGKQSGQGCAEGSTGADAKGVGVGERVEEHGLEDAAGNAKRPPNQNGTENARQADIEKDRHFSAGWRARGKQLQAEFCNSSCGDMHVSQAADQHHFASKQEKEKGDEYEPVALHVVPK